MSNNNRRGPIEIGDNLMVVLFVLVMITGITLSAIFGMDSNKSKENTAPSQSVKVVMDTTKLNLKQSGDTLFIEPK